MKTGDTAEIIDISNYQETRSFSEFFRLSHIIPLETNEENYIMDVEKIYVNSLGIFIQDGRKRILVFDSDGKYERQLNYLGKGPGEWVEIYDFDVNCSDSTIEIRSQFKKLVYGLDGHFISEKNLDESSSAFYKINNKTTLLYSASGDHNFDITVQREGERNKYLIKSNETMTGYLFGRRYARNFCQTSLGQYFVRTFDNIIYQIDSINYVTPRFKIDFGNKNYPTGKTLRPENIDELDKEYANYISNVYENKDYLYFEYLDGRIPFHVVYDKQQKGIVYKSIIVVDHANNLSLNFINYYGEVNHALSLFELAPYFSFLEMYPSDSIVLPELSQLRETDNPVLIFYKFME